MSEHKGWIALDIDGTITDQAHHVPLQTARYLQSLQANGWQLIFITGRTYSFGVSALNVFNFPFYLGVQNGADILEMPTKTRVARAYLPATVVNTLEKLYQGYEEDFIVYAGYEKGDFCYYRPHKFSEKLLNHLKKIQALSPEPWQAVETFTFDPEQTFPLIKCLGFYEGMQAVNKQLSSLDQIAVSLIRDPLAESIYLNMVTAPLATKGKALEQMINKTGKRGLIIAAGDDFNDQSMLQYADCRIVMKDAPLEMQAQADILAESAKEQGIIKAIEQAIKRF